MNDLSPQYACKTVGDARVMEAKAAPRPKLPPTEEAEETASVQEEVCMLVDC